MRKSRRNAANKSVLFLILIFIIVVAVAAFIALSLRGDTVDESLKNDSVIKTLVVLEDKKQVLFLTFLSIIRFQSVGH